MTAKPTPSASLYVGDLSPDVTEGMLFELFGQIGPVALVRVCRDTLTRRSLGYAYVNFHSVVDAERALDTLNNTLIKGRPCRIMWSQRDPSIRKSGVGNIFIKNLDPSIGHKELFDTFSVFGNILSCKVSMDENGKSKGFGFVHFENVDSAENAIKKVNDMLLQGRKVYVGKFVPKKERLRQKEMSWTNVYIKDIDPAVTEEQLKAKFEEFGKTTSVVIMKNEDNTPKGFGFVNFEKHEDAAKAVEALQGAQLGNKKIWCGPAQKKTDRQQELRKKHTLHKMEQLTKYQGTNLYIKNLEDEITEERLKKEFSVFGTIRSHKLLVDEKGNSKGVGFVCFTTTEEAQNAITQMNGHMLQGCTKPLYVAFHEPKELRRQRLQAKHVASRAKRTPPIYPGQQGYPIPPYGNIPPAYAYGRSQLVGRAWPQQTQYPPGAYPPPMANPAAQNARPGPAPRGPAAAPGGRPAQPANQPRAGAAARPAAAAPRGAARPQQPAPIPAEAAMPADLTLEYLMQFPEEQRKLLLGERLYPLIHRIQPQRSGKITGMLLDSGWSLEDLLALVNDEAKLHSKVEEAVQVLERHSQEVEQAQQTGDAGK